MGNSLISTTFTIVLRTPSNQIPYATRSDSVRHPIGFRTLSDDLTITATPHNYHRKTTVS